MNTNPPMKSQTRPRIAAAMRSWLRRRMAVRAGGRLANPFLRLSRAVGRAHVAQRFRPCKPECRTLTIRIPGPKPLSALGLGLAGGGGGSPGDAAV
ncbi:hypothetical protein [Paracoccus laeviglucosivorans]|uniref:Uncharacterized protein n=1 Tax=Paracoccus laeviglucosivorans TaxID=1197861 RepID=A0A521BFA3_9RHOB|nr:hypothetical protein [Paracoccus laeviglucosivorans]SMO45631.1 hypothetical protein SAMN06265221_102262 [Paracoccus laeviglucosivorans]